MDPIHIMRKEGAEPELLGWDFVVELGVEDRDLIGFLVHLDRDYWRELTGGLRSPEELVKGSFEFLLRRESRYLILREFDLRDIRAVFPEYETEMKQALSRMHS